MIEELKEHIYGYDQQGNPAVSEPLTIEEIVEKLNEIIRYINDRLRD